MLKDIAVPLIGGQSDAAALQAALALAKHFQAHLAALQIVELPTPPYDTWALALDPRLQNVHQTLRADAAERADQTRRQLAKEQIHHEVCVVEALYSSAWDVAACEALYTDLVVVANPDRTHREHAAYARGIASLLLQAGRPVLVMSGQKALTLPAKQAVVAWRPTAEAARALHDALPLLRAAESVDVMIYDADDTAATSVHQQALQDHLKRHGVPAQLIVAKSHGVDLGSLLLEHAEQVRADVLVAGGYGHSRIREWALGGVTRELLASARMPVWLSH